MRLTSSKLTSIALATLFILATALVGLSLVQPAIAAQCTPPAQKTTYGCCSCNVRKAIYWHCSSSGTWVQSGSACLWGQCCAFPCCV